MDQPHEMTTLTEVLEMLRLKKMDNTFRVEKKGMTTTNGKYYQPHELKIIKVFRWEGMSDPADTMVMYLIEATDGMIGYSLDAYGVYSEYNEEPGYDNFIRLIPIIQHDSQQLFQL